MRSVLFSFLVFSCLSSAGQVLLKGKIVETDGEPIPFVNIGIVDTHIGTISELNGEFELLVPAEYVGQNLLVSCVGYHRQRFNIQEIKDQELEVILKENVSQLQEIVITEKRDKPKIEKVGGVYSTASRFMTDVDYAGSAIAQKVKTEFDTTFIHWVSLGYSSRLKDVKMRIKFLGVDEEGKPGEEIIPKEIIVDLLPYDGFTKFDLEDDFLFLTEKEFFVQFEPLILKEDRQNIYKVMSWALKEHPKEVFFDDRGELIVNSDKIDLHFTKFKIFGKIGNTTYYRTSSFGKWYPSEELSAKIGISDGSSPVEESLTKAGVLSMFKWSGKKKKQQEQKSSVTDYEADQTWSYGSLADYLKRIGTLTVTGAGDFVKVYVRQTGSGSILTSNEPIFIVDNTNMGRGYSSVAASVDVNLIKSVRVLNSLTQTALYGEQGNNGVIIISTGG
ncbi:MAG: carboxypeptidase-like regulatory domain-containing protein [Cytophagales bacterium]|nr:carboxypeptidase-like regulatory domain-containing protein [Cytophagales bacterium]